MDMAANKNENNISLGITADSYFDASEKDALTGMKNKRAYSQYEKQLNSLIKKGSAPNFAVIVFDINDVTQVNDNIGHTAGDKFIKKGCYLICDTFKQSPVFHIGEDQFVALLMWGDYENRSILVERLKEIQSENAKSGLQTIAFGMADFITYLINILR
jgi:diguanylate cyclase (GGDEF)-like protein